MQIDDLSWLTDFMVFFCVIMIAMTSFYAFRWWADGNSKRHENPELGCRSSGASVDSGFNLSERLDPHRGGQ